ncbi:hypothetical protein [Brevibacillus laterosporus]|uniref:hypothetical protein n=1 Tax=Brevibacillus laterosporus TaxID=1465 RepID=UPI000CE513FF|nr:hypothetical protein [Brevibacillus laterosporus]MED1667043.1 hypothetical protein [Brevibacillus laterosporus]MED1671755.1 hypothetical protein [Brevibacillus laterosporus]MED1721094.1 hypothetical protein [Brevibacillus laterosporus]PPA80801.1 hypothetical protein C4A76_25345 [Brevibacillus laterosporus]
MKRLVLKEILLMSKIEQKAKRVSFHPRLTIIKGINHTGKSSLIKSIYNTFGARPDKMHKRWESANVTSVVKFTVDGKEYSLLRQQDFFAIYDGKNQFIQSFQKITDEFGPFLSELLNYKIKLTDRTNRLISPPPAYFLLPFYFDQDSWERALSSFSNLSQLSNWKKDMLEFYTGIKPNEYYLAKGNIKLIKEEIKKIESELAISQKVLTKLNDQINTHIIGVDISQFKEEIEEMLANYQVLKDKGDILKSKIVEGNNEKSHVQKQINILSHAITELHKDYNYALSIPEEEIDCPTCGATYYNTFTERFAIAKDENRCQDLLDELRLQQLKVNETIEIEYQKFQSNNAELNRVREILEFKQEQVKLKDVIQNEGKKELRAIMQNEINELKTDIITKEVDIKDLKAQLKELSDKKRKDKIEQKYRDYMRKYLDALDVQTVLAEQYKKINKVIEETGSGSPRVKLAYYFSLLQVMNEYSTSTFCPIIIDSPNQQDQDRTHLEQIYDFIVKNQPKDSQLIVGLVDFGDRQFDGSIEELTDPYHLLQSSEYESVADEIRELLGKAL